MALVCDIKSENPSQEDADLEDGEITDDDEETQELELNKPFDEEPAAVTSIAVSSIKKSPSRDGKEVRERSSDRERFSDERDRKEKRTKERGREDKTHRHMTEAEKSILHLRKREKMLREREKWEKQHRKDIDIVENVDDDFAKNIEKTLATILNKKEKEAAALSAGEEGKEIEKRGKKRKKHDKDKDRSKKNKRSAEGLRQEIDENEILNMRSGSPTLEMRLPPIVSPHASQQGISKSDESLSDYSSDERDERLRRRANKSRRKKETRERNRREREQRRLQEQSSKIPLQDSQGVCVFYMQGKCQKNDCPYSHEVTPPMKLELCKFYLMDCCAKGDKCSYMHSEFPCKFYHTGLQCHQGDNCKFAHGPALSDGLKQILFKHIETAPRDILGGFPRLSREEALNLIDQTQQKLMATFNEQNSTNYSNSSKPDYGGQNSGGPVMMYSNRYPNFEEREDHDREKEPSKGGIPSLFDITVPVPPELATGLDFEVKTPKNRVKQSRWQQDTDTKTPTFYPKTFTYGADQDMRINSNGDIDMRTLPALHNMPIPAPNSKDVSPAKPKFDQYSRDVNKKSYVDFTKDIDIGHPPPGRYPPTSMDTDIRQISKIYEDKHHSDTEDELHIDTGEDKRVIDKQPLDLPQTTRDLIARISATQKDNTIDFQGNIQTSSSAQPNTFDSDQNINWYSDDDDDDDNRLTIKVEDEEGVKRERANSLESISGNERDSQKDDGLNSETNSNSNLFASKTADIVGKLGDLSKIDISAEVTKLLTSMSKTRSQLSSQDSIATLSDNVSSQDCVASSSSGSQDPRIVARQDPRLANSNSQESTIIRQDPRLVDPRQRPRQSSTESQDKDKKSDKVSIYEQGGMDMKKAALEIDGDDIKIARPDVDLRQLSLPFKGMQNYTPATEIDASVNSHPPIMWKVYIVEIPRPDYTGLKLSISDAEKTGDPRLRKIFRLSVDEKDSPMSPKASPKHGSGIRADPRLRKMEEKSQESQQSSQMTYSQQLNMLQSSQFYQSLTSNQKLMLNQELSSRCDQSGSSGLHDPVLNTLLSNLNLLPQNAVPNQQSSLAANNNLGAALAILANVSKLNPIIPNQPLIGQQGLLGAAPGIPNLPPQLNQEYPINFDPRNGGLLGNAPPTPFGQFGGSVEPPFGGGYNDDFYGGYDDQGPNMGPSGGNMGPQGGSFRQGRGYNNNNNRDGRRRGNRNFGGRGRNFKRGGGRGDRDGRGGERDRDRDGGRPMRGHSPA